MIPFETLRAFLKQRVDSDTLQLKNNRSEQDKLRTAVFRLRDLEADTDYRQDRVDRITSLVSGDSQLVLWKALQAVLEQANEMTLGELTVTLQYFNLKATRQAIESAITTHKDIFRIEGSRSMRRISLRSPR